MNLKHLTDTTLLNDTLDYAQKEKHFSALVIEHIAEVKKRRAYVQLGFSSLYEFCVHGLKFSESQTMRRLNAVKVLEVVPNVIKKIEAGDINLSQLNALSPLFKQILLSPEEKEKIIDEVKGKSTREIQQWVFGKLGNEKEGQEKIKVVNSRELELTIVLDNESLELLKELKNRMHHEGVQNYSDLIKKVCAEKLCHKKQKYQLKKPKPIDSALIGKSTRAIPRPIQREVWQRADYSCEYLGQKTPSAPKVKCASSFGLELHHIIPFSLRPDHESKNILLLCKTHHQRQSYLFFGGAQ